MRNMVQDIAALKWVMGFAMRDTMTARRLGVHSASNLAVWGRRYAMKLWCKVLFFICAFLSVVDVDAAITDGLVAEYLFNGNALDSSPYGNHGTVNAATLAADRFGTASSCYYFDGNDTITVPDAASLDVSTGVTICAWVKTTQGGTLGGVVTKGSTGERYEIDLNSGKPMFHYMTGALSKINLSASNSVADNIWHYFVGTWDGTTARIFVDGQLQNSQNWSGTIVNNPYPLSMGLIPGYSFYYIGYLDDVMIYNRGLSSFEVYYLFGRTYSTPPMDVQAHPLSNTNAGLNHWVWYNGQTIIYDWAVHLAEHPDDLGVRWRLNQEPSTAISNSDSMLPRSVTTRQTNLPAAGTWYFHIAPVNDSGLVVTSYLTHVRVNYNPTAPGVSSATHPDTNVWYENNIPNFQWTPGHGSTSSVVRSYYVWDQSATTQPTTNSSTTTTYSKGLYEPENGTFYFHVRLQDWIGDLSDTAHFRVNIGTEPQGDPPQADFSADKTNGQAPLVVHFTDESTGTISSWAWDFNGDGSTDTTLQTPDPMIYNTEGWFTVRLTVSGSGGSDTEVKTNFIHVTPAAPVAAFSATPLSGYAPLEVTFTDSSSGNITNREWDFDNDGNFEATNLAAPIQYTYSVPGTYTVAFAVSGPGGSDTETKTNYVTANALPPPVADFSATPLSGYAPLHVTFTDASSGSITSREWDFDNDGTVDATNPSEPIQHTYSAPGIYTVAFAVSGPGGSDTETKTNYVTANALPPPVAEFSATPLSGYVPLHVTFTDASSGSITNREWDFDNDGTVDATNPSEPIQHTYSAPGPYTVAFAVSGPGGSDTEAKTNYVTANALPPPPVAAFSATPRTGAAPVQVTFTDLSSGTITNRQWDYNSDGVVDASNPSAPIHHTYSAGGIYSVKLTVSGPGGADIETKAQYIEVQNGIPVVAVATQQIFLSNMGSMATLDASPSSDPDGDMLFYSWREYYGNPQHGLIPIGSDSLPKINLYFPTPGRYRFIVRVSDGMDMSAETREITVYVPGRKGLVGFTPSDAIVRVPDAKTRVHNTSTDAANNVNPLDIMISESLGKYFLENVEPQDTTTGRTYWYVVERTGFLSSDVLNFTVRPDPGDTDYRQDAAIGRGYVTPLSGVIRTTNGVPIENALVSIVPGLGGVKYGSSTDTSGSFRISNPVPKGSWLMQLMADGFQPEVRDINVADGMPVLQYTLKPAMQTCDLTGRVYLAGTDRPVADAKISLGTGSEVLSYPLGQYSFTAIPVGNYILTVTKDGYEPSRLPVVAVRPGTNTLDLPISFASRGPTVFNTVTDGTSSKPVRFATVGIESTAGLLTRSDVTDFTGFYQMRDVPTGIQQFRITAPGYQTKTFSNNVAASMTMNIALTRTANWRPPSIPGQGRPEARVAQAFIYLNNLLQSATLDGSPSTGSNLRYVWRENPDNPVLHLLPAGSETMSSNQISHFTRPGIYIYELQVKSGDLLSANTAAITIFAPGIDGNVHASPSDGVVGLAAATVRAYNNYDDALNWRTNSSILDISQTEDNPIGNFVLDDLTTGSCWVVARAQAGAGFNQYGPVKRRITYSSAMRNTRINVPCDEYQLSGTIRDALSGAPLENVRIVVAPGVMSESYRTTTDATGKYRLSAITKGSSQPLMAICEGYNAKVSIIDIGGDTVYDMTLTRNVSGQLASLSGHITADYQGIILPVHYAEVIIGSGIARAFTDGNGYYQISSLPPGHYCGTIRKQGYIPKGLADFDYVMLAAGSNTIDKTLTFDDHGPVIRGVVVNEYQEPIPGVEITILPPIGPFSLWAAAKKAEDAAKGKTATLKNTADSGNTDDGGGFQLTGVPHGEREVQITLRDGRQITKMVNIDGNMEVVCDVSYDDYSLWRTRQFSLSDSTNNAVSGVNTDLDGDALANAWEYVFGFNPRIANRLNEGITTRAVSNSYRYGFRQVSGLSDVSYYLQTRTNLLRGAWKESLVQPTVVGTYTDGVKAVEVEVPRTNKPDFYWRLNLKL